MSFDWKDYLTLAENMYSRAGEFFNEEACYRSIVSRAYYSVYCLTRNYVREADQASFHSDDHHKLQEYLLKHPHKTRKSLGNQLRQLHQHRKKADYDDDLDEKPVNKANRALKQARKIQEGLTQLSSK